MKKPAGCGHLRAVLVYSWQMDDFFYKAAVMGCAGAVAALVYKGINWLAAKFEHTIWGRDLHKAAIAWGQERSQRRRNSQASQQARED